MMEKKQQQTNRTKQKVDMCIKIRLAAKQAVERLTLKVLWHYTQNSFSIL